MDSVERLLGLRSFPERLGGPVNSRAGREPALPSMFLAKACDALVRGDERALARAAPDALSFRAAGDASSLRGLRTPSRYPAPDVAASARRNFFARRNCKNQKLTLYLSY
jgi:hypothetical protein